VGLVPTRAGRSMRFGERLLVTQAANPADQTFDLHASRLGVSRLVRDWEIAVPTTPVGSELVARDGAG